jgi:hypothetical protein
MVDAGVAAGVVEAGKSALKKETATEAGAGTEAIIGEAATKKAVPVGARVLSADEAVTAARTGTVTRALLLTGEMVEGAALADLLAAAALTGVILYMIYDYCCAAKDIPGNRPQPAASIQSN